MIRFRIGHSWKRERAAPVDRIALELDGVDLLAGASEEPLAQVVPELVAQVRRLAVGGERLAQLSLAEAHLELTFEREGAEVEVAVVSLGRPARRLRRPVKVDLSELARASAKIGRAFLSDLADAAPSALRAPRRKRMVRELEQLEGARRGASEPKGPRTRGWTFHQVPHEPGALGFTLVDPADRLLAFDKRGEAPLASLLCDGAVSVRLSAGAEPWRAEAVPFLFALECARRAMELLHALEIGEPGAELELVEGTSLWLDLRAGAVALGGTRYALEPARLLRGAFELGLALSLAIVSRNKAQARNPYLEELTARCREGLAQLKAPVAAERGGKAVSPRKRRGAADRPLLGPGRVRRLGFELRWEKHNLSSEYPVRLVLTHRGPVVSAPELAIGFSSSGELSYRRVGARGVAVSAEGTVLAADGERYLCFDGGRPSARWMRDGDGTPVGPKLTAADGLLLTLSEGRAALAFCAVTGREIWRAIPPRTQRIHLALQAHRALIATDSGYLYGLELADGQIRYRVRAPLPFVAAPSPWGRKLVAVLGRGQSFALFAADAHSGEISWEQEVALGLPSAPVALGARVLLAGERDADGVLLCFGPTGQPLWERALHLGHGPYALAAVGRSVLVTAQTGAATLVAGDGRIEWLVGAAGEPLSARVRPALSRGVLIVPGERVRAIDPRGGQVLGEVDAGPGLCDLKADARLNLYLLDEQGSLKAYRLATQLAVVAAG